ncbi:hypothetical protein JW859_14730 [bacterium]|nr:hypothetical protein [bacterium]
MPAQHIDSYGQELRLKASWPAGSETGPEIAYAMYAFDVSEYHGAPEFYIVDYEPNNPENVFIGLANYGADCWEWFNIPEDGLIELPELARYTSTSGALCVAVVAMPDQGITNDTYSIHWLRLGTYDWQTTETYIAESNFAYTSLAIDSQDNPWMTYSYWGDPPACGIATVDGALIPSEKLADYGAYAQIVQIADTDTLHISYLLVTESQYEIWHARGSTGNWQQDLVATIGFSHTTSQGAPDPTPLDYLPAVDMVVDSLGRPHLCYINTMDKTLRHAWRDTDGWHAELVDDEDIQQTKSRLSLNLDSADRLHLAYFKGSSRYLTYARHEATTWQVTPVTTGYGTGYFVSIAVDSVDLPLIAVSDLSTMTVHRFTGSTWVVDLAEAGNQSSQVQLYRNPAGQVVLGYCAYNGYGQDQCLRTRHDGEWDLDIAIEQFSSGTLFATPSRFMALDTTGNPVVLAAKEDLLHANHWVLARPGS